MAFPILGGLHHDYVGGLRCLDDQGSQDRGVESGPARLIRMVRGRGNGVPFHPSGNVLAPGEKKTPFSEGPHPVTLGLRQDRDSSD